MRGVETVQTLLAVRARSRVVVATYEHGFADLGPDFPVDISDKLLCGLDARNCSWTARGPSSKPGLKMNLISALMKPVLPV